MKATSLQTSNPNDTETWNIIKVNILPFILASVVPPPLPSFGAFVPSFSSLAFVITPILFSALFSLEPAFLSNHNLLRRV